MHASPHSISSSWFASPPDTPLLPEVLYFYIPVLLVGGRGTPAGSVWGTVVAVDPQQVVQDAPVQVEDGAHHQYMHDLVAVAPVVKEARTKALRDASDVDDPAQHGQCVHGEEVAEWGGAAATYARPAEQEKGEAEQRLPGKGAQPANAAPSRDSTVDSVAGQQDVD